MGIDSMKEYIVHRGFRPHRQNSIMSFMIHDNAWYEMDLLYVDGEWYLCHDFDSFHKTVQDRLTDLWSIKRTGARYLLDIKWDTIRNHKDDHKRALNELHAIIDGSVSDTWIQFSDAVLYGYGRTIFADWRIGYIVSDPIGAGFFRDRTPDFFMLNIYSLRLVDIVAMRNIYPGIYLIGFTCPPLMSNDIVHSLDAIVCDVSL